MKCKVLKPNVVGGGQAIPIGNNFYYMRGRKHSQGGIDVGANPKTGLEVEDGEVMHLTNNDIKVYSSVPFLHGKSPAQKVMGGENPTKVFNEQERYKKRKGINDDGTKKGNTNKAQMGTIKYGTPIFNPFTKSWYRVNNKGERTYLPSTTRYKKFFGYTMYSKDGFSINYNNNGREINRRKGTQTPSITGKNRNEREQKYFDTDKEYTDSVKVIAKRYGLNPNVVASRLAREGVDGAIDIYNRNGGEHLISNNFNMRNISGPTWGLDDFYSNVKDGKTQLIEPWVSFRDEQFTNEKGRTTESAVFNKWSDVISATSAELKGRKDRLKLSYPNANDEQLDALSLGSFNMGEAGIKNYIQKNGIQSVYNTYKPFIELNNKNKKAMGGKINNELSLVRSQFRNGGLYSLTVDGKSKMKQFPTGERPKAQAGTVKRTPAEWKRRRKTPSNFSLNSLSTDADNRIYSYLNGWRNYIFKDNTDKPVKTNNTKVVKQTTNTAKVNTKQATPVRRTQTTTNNTINTAKRRKRTSNLSLEGLYKDTNNRVFDYLNGQRPYIFKDGNTSTNTTKTVAKPTTHVSSNVEQVVNTTKSQPQTSTSRTTTPTKSTIYNNTGGRRRYNTGRRRSTTTNQSTTGTPEVQYVGKLGEFKAEPAKLTAPKLNIPDKIDYQVKGDMSPQPKSWLDRTMNKLGATPNDIASLIPNIAGSFISHAINRKMLNNFSEPQAPVARRAAKLKTRININPQLDAMRESLANYERNVDSNTASSNVALARKQQARMANIAQTNTLYGDKENKETELINKDRLNRQAVEDANIKDYNEYLLRADQHFNTINEKRAENSVGLVNNINAGIQNMLSNIDRRRSEDRTLKAMMAGYPDLPIEVFEKGDVITTNAGDWYRAGIGRNRRGMKKTV